MSGPRRWPAAALRVALGRALAAVEATAFGDGGSGGPPAAFLEESLLLAVGRTFEVNSAPRQGRPEEGNLAIVVERLTDDLKQAPTLDELALLAGTTPPEPGAPRSASARPGAQ